MWLVHEETKQWENRRHTDSAEMLVVDVCGQKKVARLQDQEPSDAECENGCLVGSDEVQSRGQQRVENQSKPEKSWLYYGAP